MFNRRPRFCPTGGGRGEAQPPPPPHPMMFPQNHNPYIQNSNPYMQYFSFPNSRGPFIQNPNFVPQQLPNVGFQSHSTPIVTEDLLERVDRVAAKAHQDLLVAGESVSAWKVSQATLLALKVDSWSSLGFHLQEVPSLHRLIVTEGKVNAYIHCFVGARRITSLYDLDVAICKNEGVQRFEELRMGPLLRHPLVVHYFSVPLDAEEIVKITSEDLITYLVKYMEGCEDKDIHAEGFLDFIATKRSTASRKKLGVRIQSLRMHIISIREAMSAEDITVKNCLQALKQKPLEKYKKPGRNLVKHSGIYGHKKELDRRFGAISQRVKSFTSLHEDYSGKHVKFISSSSEDEDSYDSGNEDAKDCNDRRSQGKVTSQNTKDHDQCASSCPYPSATEEMSRLGLKPEMDGHPTPNTSGSRCDENKRSFGKKRKFENPSGNAKESLGKKRKLENPSGNAPHFYNLRKRDKVHQQKYRNKRITVDGKTKVCSLTLSDKSLGKFITTWKEACREQSVAKVFERMLQLYNPPRFRRKKIRSLFSANPFVGLLNVAVASIKHGMWDSLYDAIQSFGLLGQPGSNTPVYPSTESVCIDVDSDGMNAVLNDESNLKPVKSVTVEDIMNKVATYIDLDHASPGEGKSLLQKQLICLRNLCSCEVWLTKEFSVKEFSSLGYGEFLMFLEEYALLLPEKLRMGLLGDLCGRSPFVVSMLQCQLVVLVLQAVSGLQEDKLITKERISLLLQKQFPLISLKIMENGSIEDFLDILRNQKSSFSSSCVLFSATLFETHYCCDSFDQSENGLLESVGLGADTGLRNGTLGSVTSKEAIECLLKAPMLTDLLSWSHWDLLFAPSLGPLVEWLLNEVHIRELLCLVTRNGKVLRIDHLATADAFLEASLQGSSFQSALKLLSLFSIYGGERHVPLSLLKCHARRAIEVIYKNSMESTKENINRIYNMHGKALEERQMLGEDSINNALKVDPPGDTVNVKASKDKYGINPAASVVLRFVLDSLCYLPSEFQSFAADVFLSGLQSVIKNAPSALLSECNRPEQRLMLHEVGLTLGITEWIEDCRAFYSTAGAELSVASESLNLKDGTPTFSMNSECIPDASENLQSFERKVDIYFEADRHNEIFNKGCNEMNSETVSGEKIDNDCMQCSSELHEYQDAAHVIESIRREEFGLDPNLTIAETSMLSKQHARLGRALHCLSQELYSQDSHFILELVQNADDNIYPENVEPTLIFILESSGIVVLNNEQGFSAHNIRALCDVGNSTKKGSSAGYIGRKGIGFKSVFRVTDAPEIHSNGYHVKFDISEGQIGFVLPIVVPPRDIEGLSRLVSSEYDQTDDNRWNTCIVLPFRSKLTELLGVNSILSMFSDLHPSLLLFLHRLQCIKFRSILNGSFTVMRKEILGDGIVRISCGEEKMSWFVASKKLQATAIRPDVQTTEIAIAFTLQELDTGELKPRLDQQPVFAFLPLRRYGLKFILQGDFVLPSSREEVDGDSAWNQWLLSEIPGLFVSAEMSFCALACFQENPGKAVAAYMSFVPLMGEVHGFFSNLPRMIISKLRMSNCLLLEGDNKEWVPPSRVLRNWSEQARILLPQSLLHEHLGLGYLKKEILLSDSLAKALGVEEYGPKVLIDFAACACQKENGIKSLGLGWLSSWLCTLYALSFYYSGTSVSAEIELDLLDKLRKIPIIPLSDGTYASLADGTIWLAAESFSSGFEQENGAEAFPCLYSKLRTVSPALLSAAAAEASSMSGSMVENLTRMLHIIGVKQLSAHEIIRVHILQAMSDDRIIAMDRNLYIEYISFVMFHLHSSCSSCHTGKEFLISDIQKKALILTNHGYKLPAEESIHFSKDFGNPVDVSRLFDDNLTDWHEVHTVYLKHPCTKLLSHGLKKWREFFQMLGVTDFVQVLQIERNLVDASSTVLKNMMWDRDLISPGVLVRDWESPELLHLLTILSSNKNQEQCKYLLEVLDNLWDDCFSAKVTGYCMVKSTDESKPMSSSFINCICDIQWVVSSVDNQLHYPKDLFYDCEAVRSILGTSAPYAVPKVRSINLSRDIGFKTQVTLDDALAIVQVWRRSESPFSASVTQMSKFYTFIWNHMAISKVKIAEVFRSGPYIFVPFSNSYRHEDVVSGGFFSADEVYWHDPTGSVDQIKKLYIQCAAINRSSSALSNTVASVYPGLHEFFVNECGVHEIPPFACYIQILQQLSSISLPSQTANRVFRVFSKWANDLKSGLVGSEDTDYLKNRLLEIDCTVLPTVQDKWVSLHPSFGLVCWCDDEELRKQFKYCDSIDFLYFGELSNEEKEILQAKVVSLMRKIGIPALSEVITREAIFYGTEDCSDKASLVTWILPYAQRYIYKLHPDIYLQLKQSGFGKLNDLRIVVVEKLFYRHIIKGSNNVSKKQFECSCLIQNNILYMTGASDFHSIYMELSRLFFDGTPELHLANFLHMITTMAESGSNEEQTEVFILNSQKLPKLPDEESVWFLSSLQENGEIPRTTCASMINDDQNSSKAKRKPRINPNWPPVDWKTAPDFNFARTNHFRRRPGGLTPTGTLEGEHHMITGTLTDGASSVIGVDVDWFSHDDLPGTSMGLALQESRTKEDQPLWMGNSGPSRWDKSRLDLFTSAVDSGSGARVHDTGFFSFNVSDQLSFGTLNENQAAVTGRLGELIAFKYLCEKAGMVNVKWVNEEMETGLPYDLVIGGDDSREYVEVKTTKSKNKNWFKISTREWQEAAAKGESFSILHVVLMGQKNAKISLYKNPASLCQQGLLHLAVLMPTQDR